MGLRRIMQWIRRSYRGEEKLWVVFWGYGFVQTLIFALIAGVLQAVERVPIKERAITPDTEREIMNAWGVLILLWTVFIIINSRNTQTRVYTYLSRFLALAGMLFILACICSRWDA
jgi:hypothetical protein